MAIFRKRRRGVQIGAMRKGRAFSVAGDYKGGRESSLDCLI
jgi:hypothetical protein